MPLVEQLGEVVGYTQFSETLFAFLPCLFFIQPRRDVMNDGQAAARSGRAGQIDRHGAVQHQLQALAKRQIAGLSRRDPFESRLAKIVQYPKPKKRPRRKAL